MTTHPILGSREWFEMCARADRGMIEGREYKPVGPHSGKARDSYIKSDAPIVIRAIELHQEGIGGPKAVSEKLKQEFKVSVPRKRIRGWINAARLRVRRSSK